MKWVYVNGCICRTEESMILMIKTFLDPKIPVIVKPVEEDGEGNYVIPIPDPMEQ